MTCADSIKFLAINPNGRIPALTDTFTDGKQINLFESGSIMQYLVDRYDPEYKISFPRGTREWYEMNNWLFFQNAGVGPMQGQASKYDSPAYRGVPVLGAEYVKEAMIVERDSTW